MISVGKARRCPFNTTKIKEEKKRKQERLGSRIEQLKRAGGVRKNTVATQQNNIRR